MRKIRYADQRYAVLKIEGGDETLAEARVLKAWQQRRLPCVSLIDRGDVSIQTEETSGTARYLTTEFVDADPLVRQGRVFGPQERLTFVARITQFMKPFYSSGATVDNACSVWDRVWNPNFESGLALLKTYGWAHTARLGKSTRSLARGTNALLHGDLRFDNFLERRSPTRQLVVFDPFMGVTGPPEADIGWMCGIPRYLPEVPALVRVAKGATGELDGEKIPHFAAIRLLHGAVAATLRNDGSLDSAIGNLVKTSKSLLSLEGPSFTGTR